MFGNKSVLSNSLLIAFLISFCFLVFSCASSKMEIQKNPSIPNPEYKKLAVLANSTDIEERRTAEKIFITRLVENGIGAESCIEIIPPIIEYTDEEITRTLKERKIQAVLIIYSGDKMITSIVPTISPESSSGGYTLINSKKYTVTVVDLSTGENSFCTTIDATTLEDRFYPTWEALLHSLANKTIQTMQKNSIIKPVKKQ